MVMTSMMLYLKRMTDMDKEVAEYSQTQVTFYKRNIFYFRKIFDFANLVFGTILKKLAFF